MGFRWCTGNWIWFYPSITTHRSHYFYSSNILETLGSSSVLWAPGRERKLGQWIGS